MSDIEIFYDILGHEKQTEIRFIDLYGFIGQRVSNLEIFIPIEKIIKDNDLIVYDGSVKNYKKYHITHKAPSMSSKLLPFNVEDISYATIKKLSIFSDKIVYVLDNKKHITIAEGDNVKEVLNKNKKEFEKLIEKEVYFYPSEFIPTKAEKNKAQSYFAKSKEEFVEKIQELDGKYNVYAGLNERAENGTEAKDVISVKRIFIDVDCINKPATDRDLKEAERTTDTIIQSIEKKTGTKTTKIMSGNGYQLIPCISEIEINDKNREEIQNKIQEFLKQLIKKYSNDKVKLDNVGDLPRIIRVTGTTNLKGNRKSEFVKIHREENSKLKDYILSLKPETAQIKVGELEISLKEILEKDNRVKKLFEGDISGFVSRSEAEQSLVCHLIGLNLNKEQIFKVMASCKIGKWAEARVKYRELTYEKAVKIITKEKIKGVKKNSEKKLTEEELEYYDDEELINRKFLEPEWIIKNQIPKGEVGIMAGKRGERKTFFALYQAICAAAGIDCIEDEVGKKHKVFYISEEDAITALQLRIRGLKKGLKIGDDEKLKIRYFTLNNLKLDVECERTKKFEEILEEFKPDLIIIDTLQRCVSFDADTDNKSISEFFTGIIRPLQKKHGGTWLFIHHLRKGLSGGKPADDLMDEIRGGSEIVNYPRFVLICQVPKQSKDMMVLTPVKMSYAELGEPKVLSFNSSEEENSIEVNYMGLPKDVLKTEIKCAEAINNYLFQNSITEFKTAEILEKAEVIGYKSSLISAALKIMVENGELHKPKRGLYVLEGGGNQSKL